MRCSGTYDEPLVSVTDKRLERPIEEVAERGTWESEKENAAFAILPHYFV
jgi:hypothetical protein